jgi:hypothetical protein
LNKNLNTKTINREYEMDLIKHNAKIYIEKEKIKGTFIEEELKKSNNIEDDNYIKVKYKYINI